MRISENVYMLPIERDGDKEPMNITMISDGENLVLIDSGLPNMLEAIQQAVEAHGFDLADVSALIITHQDMDHIGTARAMLEQNGNIVTMAHEIEAPYIEGSETPAKMQKQLKQAEGDEEKTAFIQKMMDNYHRFTFPIEQTLTDGQVLPIAGGVTVIHTPGHTPGHICLYVQNDGILITGDAMNNRLGDFTGPIEEHTLDMEQAMQSLRRLKDLDVKKAICYHGGLYEGDFQRDLARILGE